MCDVYLVQRMQYLGQPLRPEIIGDAFRFDYMGAAEFEFGSVRDTLTAMKTAWRAEAPEIEHYLLPRPAGLGSYLFYVVGLPDAREHAREFIQDQMGADKWLLKERSMMHDNVVGHPPHNLRIDSWLGLLAGAFGPGDHSKHLFFITTSAAASHAFYEYITKHRK